MNTKKLLLTAAATLGLTAATMAQSVPSYVPTNGLVGWWPFNGNANDISGNGNNGNVNGATLTTDRFGNVNSSYNFDGVSNFIDCGPLSAISNPVGNITQSAWILAPTDQTPYCKMAIMSKRQVISEGWPTIGGGANGAAGFPVNNQAYFFLNSQNYSAGVTNAMSSASLTNDGNWHLVTGTKNGSTYKLFFDGILQDSLIDSYSLSSNSNLIIGHEAIWGFNCEKWFAGKIDDIGIWNRALTECEIQNLYSSQLNSTFVSAGTDLTICNGEQVTLTGTGSQNYTWNNGVVDGTAFSPTNTSDYIVTADSAGCQSTDTLTVIVNQPTNSTLNETALDTYTLNGQTYTQSGTFTQIIPNSDGCDSTITLNLTMNYTGISEVGFNLISISPNPTSGIINIQVDDNLIGTKFIIHDHVGTEISLNTFNSKIVEIDLTNLSQGIYFLSTEQKMNKSIRIIKLY